LIDRAKNVTARNVIQQHPATNAGFLWRWVNIPRNDVCGMCWSNTIETFTI